MNIFCCCQYLVRYFFFDLVSINLLRLGNGEMHSAICTALNTQYMNYIMAITHIHTLIIYLVIKTIKTICLQ